PKRKPAPRPPVPLASAPTPVRAWTARILYPVRGRRGPTARSRVLARIPVEAPYDHGPQVLLVLAARSTVADGVWYRLLLPDRPNGAAAWVPARAVSVTPTPYRVKVRLGARRAELLRSGRVVLRWTVAVGTAANPTPTGRFAVSEVVSQADPRGFYGPAILPLTAHSTRLSDFDGGDGRVALHGTSRPDLLGTAASHGCVRMPNAVTRRLARTLRPGVPVEITP
ncbi:MAG: L,D-transpeptidase, partial [Actinomycetota bacterium]